MKVFRRIALIILDCSLVALLLFALFNIAMLEASPQRAYEGGAPQWHLRCTEGGIAIHDTDLKAYPSNDTLEGYIRFKAWAGVDWKRTNASCTITPTRYRATSR